MSYGQPPIVKTIGFKSGYVDKPDPRKVHRKPIVRIGGVAIFCRRNLFPPYCVVDGRIWYFTPRIKTPEIWGVTIGACLFFLIGFADDLFSLSAGFRLIVQSVVSSFAWWQGVRIDFLTIPFFWISTDRSMVA